MFPLTEPVKSLLKNKTHRFCVCWKITRRDGVILKFTDHNAKITLGSDVYTPISNFDASAIRKEDSLQGQNVDFTGVISDVAITSSDMRAGKYRGAIVEQFDVDWLYPWAGNLYYSKFFLKKVRFTGEIWHGELEGMSGMLGISVGEIYKRDCRYDLADSRCTKDISAMTAIDAAVTAIDTQRLVFTADDSLFSGKAADWWKFGKITWKTGANSGATNQILTSTAASGSTTILSLMIQTDFDIAVSDTFDLEPGCDKLGTTCKAKFNNMNNHGGFTFIPGLDKVLQTPEII